MSHFECVSLCRHVSQGITINTKPCSYLTAYWRGRPQTLCKDACQNGDSPLESVGAQAVHSWKKQLKYNTDIIHLLAAVSTGLRLRH